MIRALFFDLFGTLIDIRTNESDDNVFRVTANFLAYHGVSMPPDRLKMLYFELNRAQRLARGGTYPEFDVVRLFERIVRHGGGRARRARPLAAAAARVFRAASLFRLAPYPGAGAVLTALKKRYRMAVVSDGQRIWEIPELHAAGIAGFFEEIVVSGDLGFRKPDPRMYETALRKMALSPAEVIFVGNDMFRDIYGAKSIGMKAVFFDSGLGGRDGRGAAPDAVIRRLDDLPGIVEKLDDRPASAKPPFTAAF